MWLRPTEVTMNDVVSNVVLERTAMMRLVAPTCRMFKAVWQDTSGIMLPYATIMLFVIVGLSLLGVDGARYMSLQTQMQNAADALALAGARELDKRVGARNR